MSFEYDPEKNISHYPMPMARYGKTLYGGSLYRIVLASSVCHLVGGFDPTTGETGYHWRRSYPHITSAWILERWQLPLTSKYDWDNLLVDPISGWPINGPYPARGEYYLAWEFDQGVDAENLDAIIGAVERGRDRSISEIHQHNQAEYDAETKQNRTNTYDEIRDSFTAFGSRPFASSRVAGGTKTSAPLMTAEQAGMPIPRRQILPSTNRRTCDVRDIQVTNTLVAGRV